MRSEKYFITSAVLSGIFALVLSGCADRGSDRTPPESEIKESPAAPHGPADPAPAKSGPAGGQ